MCVWYIFILFKSMHKIWTKSKFSLKFSYSISVSIFVAAYFVVSHEYLIEIETKYKSFGWMKCQLCRIYILMVIQFCPRSTSEFKNLNHMWWAEHQKDIGRAHHVHSVKWNVTEMVYFFVQGYYLVHGFFFVSSFSYPFWCMLLVKRLMCGKPLDTLIDGWSAIFSETFFHT